MHPLQMDPDNFETLLRSVSNWLPGSMFVHHWLKIASTRMAPLLDGAACYVDRWPDPSRVCCVDPVVYEGLARSYFVSFAMSDDQIDPVAGFLEFLHGLDSVLQLSTPRTHAVCGLSLPESLVESYSSYFRQRNCEVKFYENDAYWVPPELHPALARVQISPPDGFYFDTLRLDEVDLIDETWPHRWIGSLPLNARKICYMPNVCLRRWDDGELASFEIMHSEFGLINHLYTMPDFRRRGFARTVESRQMQKALDADMIPYKLIVRENRGPVKLTEQIGFWRKYGQYPFVEMFTSEGKNLLERTDSNSSTE